MFSTLDIIIQEHANDETEAGELKSELRAFIHNEIPVRYLSLKAQDILDYWETAQEAVNEHIPEPTSTCE